MNKSKAGNFQADKNSAIWIRGKLEIITQQSTSYCPVSSKCEQWPGSIHAKMWTTCLFKVVGFVHSVHPIYIIQETSYSLCIPVWLFHPSLNHASICSANITTKTHPNMLIIVSTGTGCPGCFVSFFDLMNFHYLVTKC